MSTRPAWLDRPLTGAARIADVVAFNAAIVCVALEVGLRLMATYLPGPFVHDASSAAHRIEAHRFPAGTRRFGKPFNADGFYDDDFAPDDAKTLTVAVVSDSFGLGIVPHRRNFTTVAERVLADRLDVEPGRVVLQNFGLAAIGMSEYLLLLEDEVLPREPDLVLLAIFAGNDIIDFDLHQQQRIAWKAFQTWWLGILPARLLAARPAAAPGLERVQGVLGADGDDREFDRREDRPTFSEPEFLRIERVRSRVSQPERPGTALMYERFFAIFDRIVERVGDRLLVVVIPDEYQVNDALYRRVKGELGEVTLHRDYPQERILQFCEARSLACLDCYPPCARRRRSRRPTILGTRTGTCTATRSRATRSPASSFGKERPPRGDRRLGFWSAGLQGARCRSPGAVDDEQQLAQGVVRPGLEPRDVRHLLQAPVHGVGVHRQLLRGALDVHVGIGIGSQCPDQRPAARGVDAHELGCPGWEYGRESRCGLVQHQPAHGDPRELHHPVADIGQVQRKRRLAIRVRYVCGRGHIVADTDEHGGSEHRQSLRHASGQRDGGRGPAGAPANVREDYGDLVLPKVDESSDTGVAEGLVDGIAEPARAGEVDELSRLHRLGQGHAERLTPVEETCVAEDLRHPSVRLVRSRRAGSTAARPAGPRRCRRAAASARRTLPPRSC